MRKLIRYACLAALIFPVKSAVSQVEVLEDLVSDAELQVYRQHTYFAHIHSNGFGLGYRFGRIRSIERYTFQEFEFLQLKHPKAQRLQGSNMVGTNRRFIWGGVNQLYAFRYGFGTQRTLNEKPYWGGVQVSYIASAGGVLGLAIPQYLNIVHSRPSTEVKPGENPLYVRAERYDPNNQLHNELGWRINGMGPMFKGLFNLRPYPGIYAKFAFNFEFGKYNERVNALEVGAMLDVFPIPVPMMAVPCETCTNSTKLKKDKNFFLANFYAAYHFGRRK
jgi:hypothetical protein